MPPFDHFIFDSVQLEFVLMNFILEKIFGLKYITHRTMSITSTKEYLARLGSKLKLDIFELDKIFG